MQVVWYGMIVILLYVVWYGMLGRVVVCLCYGTHHDPIHNLVDRYVFASCAFGFCLFRL